MLILKCQFDYKISMFKFETKNNQNQLELNILRYMKRTHTCDLISLIQYPNLNHYLYVLMGLSSVQLRWLVLFL